MFLDIREKLMSFVMTFNIPDKDISQKFLAQRRKTDVFATVSSCVDIDTLSSPDAHKCAVIHT